MIVRMGLLRAHARWIVLLLVTAIAAGCGGSGSSSKKTSRRSKAKSHAKSKKKSGKKRRPIKTHFSDTAPGPVRPHRNGGSLADLLDPSKNGDEGENLDDQPILGAAKLEKIDEKALLAAGIRKVESQHLTLYTDLRPSKAIDELPEVFDQAVPQWCAYFGIDPERVKLWRVNGFLIKDKSLFVQAGLIPEDLPSFLHRYAYQTELWLLEQSSDYYRRHLLLHEGTHALMNSAQGRAGAPWYMEGIAELMGTHRWTGGKLTLRRFPATREEVPLWGRVKIVKDELAAKHGMGLGQIFQYDRRAHLANEPYGWCWAACAFLDAHPSYQKKFRGLYKESNRADADFNRKVLEILAGDADQWSQMQQEWQLFVTGLEYGYDVAKTAVDFTPGEALPADGADATVAADRGWQNSGLKLEAGEKYTLQASGRYQIAKHKKIWWCEPGGVSVRYYQGKRLGMLLATVLPEKLAAGKLSPLVSPQKVGLSSTVSPKQTGTLYFRINDSAGQLHDNAGTLSVRIRKAD